jgi:hypothetical protein
VAQIKMLNGSGRTIKIGYPVKLHATKKNSFDYANLGDIIIGTASQQIPSGSWGMINLFVGNPKITVSEAAPANPSIGDLWFW